MPKWETHIEYGIILSDYLGYDKENKELFLIGNILPDINNGYLVKEVSNVISHEVTHFISSNHLNHLKFYNKYKSFFNNPLVKGYFTHLYLDYYFNNDYYSNKFDSLDKEYLKKRKQNDFDVFNNKFINNKLILNNLEDIISNSKLIEEININVKDLNNVINYLNNNIKCNKEYIYYKEDYLYFLFNNSVNSIKELINKL